MKKKNWIKFVLVISLMLGFLAPVPQPSLAAAKDSDNDGIPDQLEGFCPSAGLFTASPGFPDNGSEFAMQPIGERMASINPGGGTAETKDLKITVNTLSSIQVHFLGEGAYFDRDLTADGLGSYTSFILGYDGKAYSSPSDIYNVGGANIDQLQAGQISDVVGAGTKESPWKLKTTYFVEPNNIAGGKITVEQIISYVKGELHFRRDFRITANNKIPTDGTGKLTKPIKIYEWRDAKFYVSPGNTSDEGYGQYMLQDGDVQVGNNQAVNDAIMIGILQNHADIAVDDRIFMGFLAISPFQSYYADKYNEPDLYSRINNLGTLSNVISQRPANDVGFAIQHADMTSPQEIRSGFTIIGRGNMCTKHRDTYGDGTPDYLDSDSDGDGIPDWQEAGFASAEAAAQSPITDISQLLTAELDRNNDGIPDYIQPNSPKPTVDAVNVGATSLSGTADPYSKMVIDQDGTKKTVFADNTGKWTVTGLTAITSSSKINVTQEKADASQKPVQDTATKKNYILSYPVSPVISAKSPTPSIDQAYDGDQQITLSQGTAGASFKLTLASGESKTGVFDVNGKATVNFDTPLATGTQVQVTQTVQGMEQSDPAQMTVKPRLIENPTEPTPVGYYRVQFKAGANGSLKASDTHTYDVLAGTVFSKITVPARVPATNYVFDKWTNTLPADTAQINASVVYTASFKLNSANSITPEGIDLTIPYGGSYDVKDQVKTATGSPSFPVGTSFTDVSAPAINTNEAGVKTVTVKVAYPDGSSETVTFQLTVLADIIENPAGATPNGYFRVEFKAGANGSLKTGDTHTYDVLAGTLFSKIKVPARVPAANYVFDKWTDTLPAGTSLINSTVTYTASFKLDSANTITPEGIDLTIPFGGSYDVKDQVKTATGSPSFPVGTSFTDVSAPAINTNEAGVKAVTVKVAYPDGSSETVTFQLTVLAAIIENPAGATPDGYFRVEFKAGANGSLKASDTHTYDVLAGSLFSKITVPARVPDANYVFDKWTNTLPEGTSKITANATYTASFKLNAANTYEPVGTALVVPYGGSFDATKQVDAKSGTAALPVTASMADVTAPAINTATPGNYTAKVKVSYQDGSSEIVDVPVTVLAKIIENPAGATPEGYVRVEFKIDANGKFKSGETTIYDVLSGTLFSEITTPTYEANSGYVFDKWTDTLPTAETAINASVVYTASFKPDQANTFEPVGKDLTIPFGGSYDVASQVVAKTGTADLPQGTTFTDVTAPAINTNEAGVKTVTVKVTYPDGSSKNVTFQLTVLAAIIENPAGATPDGYVRVEFKAGANGSLKTGDTHTYDVVTGTLFSKIKEPALAPDANYVFDKWTDTLPTAETAINASVVYTASFKLNEASTYEPVGTALVVPYGGSFDATKQVAAKSGTAALPGTVNMTDVTSPAINTATPGEYVAKVKVTYQDGSSEIVDVPVTVLAKIIENPAGATPDGYVRIEFKTAANGSIKAGEVAIYDVLSGTSFNQIKLPTLQADTGYVFDKWTDTLPIGTDPMNTSVTYTASFKLNSANSITPEGIDLTIPYGGSYDVKNQVKTAAGSPNFPAETSFTDVSAPAIDTSVAGDQVVTVKVTYPDGSSEEVTFTLTVLPKIMHDPAGETPAGYVRVTFVAGANGAIKAGETQVYDVLKGTLFSEISEPTLEPAENYIFDQWTDTLPAGTDPINTSVTYTASFKLSEVSQYTPEGTALVLAFGASLDATKQVAAKAGTPALPDTAVLKDITEPAINTSSPGNYTAKVKVNYQDGTSEVVDVPVTVLPKIMKDPAGEVPAGYVRVTFVAGENGAIKAGETKVYDVLKGSLFSEISEPALIPAENYLFDQWTEALPAGTDEINASVTYTASFVATQSSTHTPEGKDLTIPFGGSYKVADQVAAATGTNALPVGTKFTDVSAPAIDTNSPGDQVVTVKVTYPDGSSEEVTFTLTVLPKIMKDPAGEVPAGYVRVTFVAGENGAIKAGETKVYDVLKGTLFSEISEPALIPAENYLFEQWTETLPAGTDAINASVTYTASFVATQSSTHTPEGKDLTIPFGGTYTVADQVAAATGTSALPAGTKFTDISAPVIDTNVAGDQVVTVKVTYPDGSFEEVTFTLTVLPKIMKDPAGETPAGYVRVTFVAGANGAIKAGKTKVYDVLKGTLFSEISEPALIPAENYLFEKWTEALPAGTDPIDVDVTYTASFKLNEANTYQAVGTALVVPFAGSFDATKQVAAKAGTADLPVTASMTDVTAPAIDTSKPGDYVAKVKVSYQDGSSKIVDVPVTVLPKIMKDPAGEVPAGYVRVTFVAGENGAIKAGETKVYDVLKGSLFSEISEPALQPAENYLFEQWTEALPAGTDPINTSVTYTASFVATQSSTHSPKGKDLTIPFGGTYTVADQVAAATGTSALPAGTKFTDVSAPVIDTKLAGDQVVTVKVTYPDGSSEEVTFTLKVLPKIMADPTGEIPAGYVRVSFVAGANGSFKPGTQTYDVLKGTVFSELVVPTPLPAADYKFEAWTAILPALDSLVNETVSYEASFVKKEMTARPVFDPIVEGAKSISGTGVPGAKLTVTLPDGSSQDIIVSPDAKWSLALDQPLLKDAKVKATQIEADKLESLEATSTALPKIVENPQTVEPQAPYVRVVFETAPNGKLTEPRVFDLAKGTKFSEITPPTATAAAGYYFEGWIASLPQDPDFKVIENMSFKPSFVQMPQSQPAVVKAPTAGDLVVSGEGIPGSKVFVTLPNGKVLEATVQPDKTWTVDVASEYPAGLEEANKIIVEQVEANKTKSIQTETLVDAKPAPAQTPAPKITSPNEGDTSISGTGVKGAKLTVNLPNGQTVNTIVKEDGTWTVDVANLYPTGLAKDTKVTASQTAEGFSPSNEDNKTVIPKPVLEQSPAPKVNTPTEGDTKVSGTGIKNAKVTVTLPNGKKVETTVLEDGTWSVDIVSDYPQGLAKDDQVKASQIQAGYSESNEDLATASPKPLPEQSPAPKITTPVEGATEISGTGIPDAKLTVTLPNGKTIDVTVIETGLWIIDVSSDYPTGLAKEAKIKATQTVPNKTESVQDEAIVTAKPVVSQTPAPNVESPLEGAKTVKGSGVAGATLTLTLPNGSTKNVLVDQNGQWSIDVSSDYPNGLAKDASIKASQVAAGETASPSDEVLVLAKPALEESPAPKLIAPVEGDKIVKGSGEVGANLTLTLPDGSTKDVVVDQDGQWTIDVSAEYPNGLAKLAPLSASQTVENKAPSQQDHLTVIPKPNPEESPAPKIITPVEGEKVVKGSGVAGATLTLTLPNGSTKEVTVADDGTWSVDVSGEYPSGLAKLAPLSASQQVSGKMASPQDEAKVIEKAKPAESELAKLDQVEAGAKVVTGTGVAGATVTVTLPNGDSETVVVPADGKWSLDVSQSYPQGLAEGANLEVSQLEAGKLLSPSSQGKVIAKTPELVQLPTPQIDPLKPGQELVRGRAYPGSKLTLVLPDGSSLSTTVDSKGKWEIDTKPHKLNVGAELRAFSEKAGLVKSNETTQVVPAAQADSFEPKFKGETIVYGSPLNLLDNLINKDELPQGIKIREIPGSVDNKKLGLQKAKLEVSYPDGSKEIVEVLVSVVDPDYSLTVKKELYDLDGKSIQEQKNFAFILKGPSFPEGKQYSVFTYQPVVLTGLKPGTYQVALVAGEGKGYKVSNSGLVTLTADLPQAEIKLVGRKLEAISTETKTPETTKPATVPAKTGELSYQALSILVLALALALQKSKKKLVAS